MKRFFKWAFGIVLGLWLPFSSWVTLFGGFEYVYAFNIAPRFYQAPIGGPTSVEESSTAADSFLSPPEKVDKVFPPLDVEKSMVPGLLVIHEYWRIEKAEAILFTYEKKPSLDLYITSWDAKGKRSTKKLEIEHVKHRHMYE